MVWFEFKSQSVAAAVDDKAFTSMEKVKLVDQLGPVVIAILDFDQSREARRLNSGHSDPCCLLGVDLGEAKDNKV